MKSYITLRSPYKAREEGLYGVDAIAIALTSELLSTIVFQIRSSLSTLLMDGCTMNLGR